MPTSLCPTAVASSSSSIPLLVGSDAPVRTCCACLELASVDARLLQLELTVRNMEVTMAYEQKHRMNLKKMIERLEK